MAGSVTALVKHYSSIHLTNPMNKIIFAFILTALAVLGYDETSTQEINEYTRARYEARMH